MVKGSTRLGRLKILSSPFLAALMRMSAPQRPRRHPYVTFEYSLDLKFCEGSTPSLARNDILASIPQSQNNKPVLICTFCPRINSFASIIAIWGHIFHQHQDVQTQDRLRVICEKGQTWAKYCSGRIIEAKKTRQ